MDKKRLIFIFFLLAISIINILLILDICILPDIYGELIPGYYIITEEQLTKVVKREFTQCEHLQDQTFKFRDKNEASEKRIYAVIDVNDQIIGNLCLIYKRLECSTCDDVLFAVFINNNNTVEHIFPIKKIDLKGKKINGTEFFNQFLNFNIAHSNEGFKNIEVISGATMSCKKIQQGIEEAIRLFDGAQIHENIPVIINSNFDIFIISNISSTTQKDYIH